MGGSVLGKIARGEDLIARGHYHETIFLLKKSSKSLFTFDTSNEMNLLDFFTFIFILCKTSFHESLLDARDPAGSQFDFQDSLS